MARRARGQHNGRPKAPDANEAAFARRMHSTGDQVTTIAETLGGRWPRSTALSQRTESVELKSEETAVVVETPSDAVAAQVVDEAVQRPIR